MARDVDGNYVLPTGNPVLSDTVIESAWANTTLEDVKNALTDSLSRTGRGNMEAQFKAAAGSAAAPSISFANSPSAGMDYNSTDNTLTFSIGGVPIFTVNASAVVMNESCVLSEDATAAMQAVTKQQLDAVNVAAVKKAGDIMSGDLVLQYENPQFALIPLTDGAHLTLESDSSADSSRIVHRNGASSGIEFSVGSIELMVQAVPDGEIVLNAKHVLLWQDATQAMGAVTKQQMDALTLDSLNNVNIAGLAEGHSLSWVGNAWRNTWNPDYHPIQVDSLNNVTAIGRWMAPHPTVQNGWPLDMSYEGFVDVFNSESGKIVQIVHSIEDAPASWSRVSLNDGSTWSAWVRTDAEVSVAKTGDTMTGSLTLENADSATSRHLIFKGNTGASGQIYESGNILILRSNASGGDWGALYITPDIMTFRLNTVSKLTLEPTSLRASANDSMALGTNSIRWTNVYTKKATLSQDAVNPMEAVTKQQMEQQIELNFNKYLAGHNANGTSVSYTGSLNDIAVNSWYVCSGGAVTDKPAAASDGLGARIFTKIYTSSSNAWQEYTQLHSTDHKTWVRNKTSNTWNAWEEITPAMASKQRTLESEISSLKARISALENAP